MIKRTRVPEKLNNSAKNIIVLILGTLLSFLALEAIVRFYPSAILLSYLEGRGTFKPSKWRADIGEIAPPHQKGSRCANCFRIYPIYSNSLGFRGKDWNGNKGFRIAILGDSCLEGLEVEEGESTSVMLAKLLNKDIFNTAISSSATFKQVAIYKKFLRPLKPNLVLLFFLPDNDILENSCELTELLVGKNNMTNPCGYFSGNDIKIRTGSQRRLPPDGVIRKFIKDNCKSCIILNRVIFQLAYKMLYKHNSIYNQVYLPVHTREWREAWLITEKALSELRQEIENDGGKLVVFIIPAWANTIRDAKELNSAIYNHFPEGFDLNHPIKVTKDLMAKHNIPFLSLMPYLLEYRDKFNLEFPYFSYRCDGHWNPLGHFIVSHIVAKYLVENGWVPFPAQDKDILLKKIDNDLALPPRKILGEDAYRQIYKRGFYCGHSDAAKVLEQN